MCNDRVRLLLVDDQPLVLRAISALLRKHFDVVLAAGTDEALVLLSDSAVDCVLTDFQMPGRDGLALLEEVRNARPHILRLLSSGGKVLAVQAKVESGLVEGFFPKPIDAGAVHARICALLADPSRQAPRSNPPAEPW